MTGSGTFESYFSVGAGCAATPDGRLNGQPTASDCSPQPFAQVNILNVVTLHLHINVLSIKGVYIRPWYYLWCYLYFGP